MICQILQKAETNGPGFYYIVDWRGAHQRFGQMLTFTDYLRSDVSLNVDPALMPYEVMVQAGNDIGLGPIPEIVSVGIEEVGKWLSCHFTSSEIHFGEWFKYQISREIIIRVTCL